MPRPSDRCLAWALIAVAVLGCARRPVRELVPPSRLDAIAVQDAYLKAHMKDGNVYILKSWTIDSEHNEVSGEGRFLGINRELLRTGQCRVPIDSVAIFETNRVVTSPVVAGMAVVTGASLALTALCLSNPKACFGSCPTFYAGDGDKTILQAEGFSASVSPSLEARDVDALYRARPNEDRLEIVMRNEALETHVVRAANLLVVPRGARQRVFADAAGITEDNRGFWLTRELVPPARALDDRGDCAADVARFDGIERSSAADSTNLAAREIAEIRFDDVPDGDLGLVVAFRQTLLTTYLFYQTLAYMGTSAGEWYASLERAGPQAKDRIGGLGDLIGGIRVLVEETPGVWSQRHEIRETGPLATNVVVAPLECGVSRPVRVRLQMARGAWRLDMVALTVLEARAGGTRIHPAAVLRDGEPSESALASLLGENGPLTTFPGDDYTLVYEIPRGNESCELFLETQGYYLEWMRDEWLQEEDHAAAAVVLFRPERAVVEMAPKYKKVEPMMESSFWNSRYARP